MKDMEEEIKTYSINLQFDKESEFYLNSIIQNIATITGNYYRLKKAIPPHITIGMFKAQKDTNSFISLSLPLLNKIKPFCINIEKFDVLKGKILFASVKEKDKLQCIVKEFSELLSKTFKPCCNNLYNPDIFLPHITLATGLSNKQREEALRFIEKISIPKKITINKVYFAITKPYEIFYENK